MEARFQHGAHHLSARQIAVVREWQQTNRFYELVQAVQRGTLDIDRLAVGEYRRLLLRLRDLDAAIASCRCRESVTVYRGIRSLRQAFGVDVPEGLLADPVRVLGGYTATSVFRDVALRDFTQAGGALLEIDLPPGFPALWVAGVGDPQLRWQGEVLLPADLVVRFAQARHTGGLAVFSVQVT